MAERGVVAAGHPLTAQAGADVLRAGGNAVDAALAALMTSFMTEPLLTGLGAGGYMLVAPPGGEPVLLDFMVERRPGAAGERAPLDAVVIDFGDAVQVFHIGAVLVRRLRRAGGDRGGGRALRERAADRAGRARDRRRARRRRGQRHAGAAVGHARPDRVRHAGVPRPLLLDGRAPREGDVVRDPDLADGDRAAGGRGRARRSTRATSAAAVSDWVLERGGTLHARRTSRPTRRSRASRSASATTAARCSPTRRRARAAC